MLCPPSDWKARSASSLESQFRNLVSHPDLKPKLDSWEDFRRNPIVDYVGSENIFQKWISAHYRSKGASMDLLDVRARINNMESIFYLLRQKVGYTIFPSEPLLGLLADKALKAHKTPKTVSNPLYLVRRQGQAFSRRTRALRELVVNLAENSERLSS